MQLPGDPFHRGVPAPQAPTGAGLGNFGSFFGAPPAPNPWGQMGAQVGAQVGNPPPSPWDQSGSFMSGGGLSRAPQYHAPPMRAAPHPQAPPPMQPPPMRQAPQVPLMGMYQGGIGSGPLGQTFMQSYNGQDWDPAKTQSPQQSQGWSSTGQNTWTK